jgi:hypothetical protein
MWRDSIPSLSLVLNRTGNMSVYGDITVDFISATGKVTQVSHVKGIAVYTPTTSRSVKVLLDKKAGINYKTGRLHVTYTTPVDAKSVKMVETDLALF